MIETEQWRTSIALTMVLKASTVLKSISDAAWERTENHLLFLAIKKDKKLLLIFFFYIWMQNDSGRPSWTGPIISCGAVLLCRFAAGDVVMMKPCNALEDVQQFCQLLRLDPEARFTLRATDNSAGMCVSVCVFTVCIIHDFWFIVKKSVNKPTIIFRCKSIFQLQKWLNNTLSSANNLLYH